MIEQAVRQLLRPGAAAAVGGPRARGFRLVRYFTLTSIVAFALVAFALYFLERMEERFFEQVQQEQATFFAQVQAEFARQHEEAARDDLLRAHEAAHVNLTRVFANTLWETYVSPFVARAQQLPVERCRAIAAGDSVGVSKQRQTCFDELGRKIMSLHGFAELDARVHAMMRDSTVFKIKVFDLRGITVYSSEHNQIGEDKVDNRGWKVAAGGRPASELTHRDRFSAFEGVVENRDLISSYIPRLAPGSDKVAGVFEIYSDITPLLEQIKATSAKLANLGVANQAKVSRAAAENQAKVRSSSNRFLAILGGLFAMLYIVLSLLARNGQRIIDMQALAQERSIQREQQWHREKMAALATMAANVAHEVGNPLATISVLAENIAIQQAKGECLNCRPQAILEQTDRIATMTRQIADFAAARSETRESVDVNQMVKAVCDFLSHDRRFREAHIEFRAGERLPALVVIPDHLNEALMSLLQACAQGDPERRTSPQRVLVRTEARGENVLIHIGCEPTAAIESLAIAEAFPDSRFESARRRVAEMGGRFSYSDGTVEIALPSCLAGVAAV